MYHCGILLSVFQIKLELTVLKSSMCVSLIHVRAMVHVAQPWVGTTTSAAALTIVEVTTASMSLTRASENVFKEKLVFPAPVLSLMDCIVLLLALSVLEAMSHMTTVAPPLVVTMAPVPELMLVTAAIVKLAILVKTVPILTTVCQIPALGLTRLPVSTIQKVRGLFVSVSPAGEVTSAIRTLTNARVIQTSVMEADV